MLRKCTLQNSRYPFKVWLRILLVKSLLCNFFGRNDSLLHTQVRKVTGELSGNPVEYHPLWRDQKFTCLTHTAETWINSGRCQGWVHGYTCYCYVLSSSNINVTPFLIECTPKMTFHPRIKSTYMWDILWLLVTLHSRKPLRNGCPHVIRERPLMSEFLKWQPLIGNF